MMMDALMILLVLALLIAGVFALLWHEERQQHARTKAKLLPPVSVEMDSRYPRVPR